MHLRQATCVRFPLLVVLALVLPASVARAEVHGGIEIGSTGVKATVIDFVPDPEGYELIIKMAESKNTSLVTDLGKTGRFNADALAETVKAVEQFREQMRDKYQVPADRIYVVASSGLFSPLEGKPDLIEANRKILAEAIHKVIGKQPAFIDVRREAELSIVGTVPRKFRDESVLIDIGGGNTKGGYRDADGGFVTVDIPYGTRTYGDLVRTTAEKNGVSFVKQSVESRGPILQAALKAQLAGKDGLVKRPRVYLSGGSAWALATLTHPGDARAFTALSPRDIEVLQARLLANPEKFPEPDLSALIDPTQRKAADDEVGRVKKVFNPDQLFAGTQILQALSAEMKLDSKDRKLYFARHGQIGWLLAYVAEQGTAPR